MCTAKRNALKLKESRFKKIYDNFFEGSLKEDFYILFKSSQTKEILSGYYQNIDSITIDKYVFKCLNTEARVLDEEVNNMFIKNIINKNILREASFNKRLKQAHSTLSTAQNILNFEERVKKLIEAFFIAPEGAKLKLQIMRKIVLTFLGYTYEGKTINSLRKEVKNKKKQRAIA